MKQRLLSSLILVCTLCFCNISKGQTWVSIDGSREGKSYSIKTIESNASFYKATISIHGFYDFEKQENATIYHQILFDIPSVLSEIGKPALPTINQVYALPYGNKCNVTVKESKWTDISIGKIYPCQNPLYNNHIEGGLFSIDEKTYNSFVFSPSIAVISELGKWKGITSKSISFCPFIYHPQDNVLSVLSEFDISIKFDTSEKSTLTCLNDINLFANGNILSNNEQHKTSNMRSDNDNYLIIVGDIPNVINSQALNLFCQWKALKGYRTRVVSTTTIGETDTDIKQYIVNSNGIEYVLFIGDDNKIPSHYIDSLCFDYNKKVDVHSDYWYGCLEGDDDRIGDIPIGRFPVNTLNDLENIVEKTIRYESTPSGSGFNSLLVADRFIESKNLLENIRTTSYNSPINFSKLYGGLAAYGGDEATNTDLINEINEGYNIVTYFGHGQDNAWGNTGWGWNSSTQFFYDTYIDSLNTNTNSIYLPMACLTGNITNNVCMLRTFLNSDHGAVAFHGATKISLTDANETFLKLFYKKLLNNNIHNYGDLILASHRHNISIMSENAIVNAFQYIWGGDPTLDIRPNIEQGCVFGEVSIRKNESTLSICTDNIWSYNITFTTDNGVVLDSCYVLNASGSINLPNTNGYLILSKTGYIPYIVYLNVTDSFIQNTSFTSNNTIYLNNGPVFVGNNVTTSKPYGDVIVTNGGKLTIQNNQGVTITNGFECQNGGELEIYHSSYNN